MLQSLQRFLYVANATWRDDSNRGQRLRRVGLLAGWQLWKRLVRLPIVIPVFNHFRLIVYPDCHISPGFIYYRIPDCHEIAFIRAQLGGGVLVDVGANVGTMSILLADKIRHAILFEPNPNAARRARENLAINQLAFEVHELALSDSSGTVRFEDAGGVSSTNRTVVGFDTAFPTRVVPCITFDEFLRNRGINSSDISFVKIDVEGHENSVLRGMTAFLKERRPRLIMFEYLQRTDLAETLRLFGEAEYEVFELSTRGAMVVQNNVRPLQNLFACPRETGKDFALKAQ